MNFTAVSFSNLTLTDLYQILQLRSEIFVVEQNCVYQDIDGKDTEAIHIIGKKENKIIAYTRIFNTNTYFKNYASIGRVVVKKTARKKDYGHQLMHFSIKIIKEKYKTSTIKIGAQTYLEKFYNKHGFIKIGKEYIEDGIPHIYMIKE